MAAEIKARGYTYNEVVANLDPLLHGRLEGTMQGWYAPANYVGSTMIAHWITFLVLSACTMYLARDSFANRGPRGNTAYYSGYNEQYNIALYVNLMACVAYYGKVVADTSNHNFSNVGPFIPGLGNYRYADYMLTCPLLVMDLLFQLRAPFKITSAFLIFVVLLCGVVTDFYPPDVLYGPSVAWFIFGCFWYIIAYIFLYTIITKQYKRLLEISKETEAKKSLGPLKLAIYTFFSIWLIFPCVWLLTPKGLNMLDEDSAEVLFCICDLLAKSMYGFALSRFRFYYDKKMYDLFEQLGYDPENIEEEMQKELKLDDHDPKESHHQEPRPSRIQNLAHLAKDGNHSLPFKNFGNNYPPESPRESHEMAVPSNLLSGMMNTRNFKNRPSLEKDDEGVEALKEQISRINDQLAQHMTMKGGKGDNAC